MKSSKKPGGVIRLLCLLAAAVCLALGGCPLAVMDDFYRSVQPEQVTTVSDYDLQAYAPIPEAP